MNKLLKKVISKLVAENVEKHSFISFMNWFEGIVPKLIHKYMLRSQSMKVCSTISPEFAKIANSKGFNVGTVNQPGHVINVLVVSDGIFLLDLSHIQFLCKNDISDKENRAEVIQNFKNLKTNPMSAVKIEKVEKVPFNAKFEDEKLFFDPVSSFNDYEESEAEEDNHVWFSKIK